jgi:hypothetical protein
VERKLYCGESRKINLRQTINQIDARLGASSIEEHIIMYNFFKAEVKPKIAHIEKEPRGKEGDSLEWVIVEGIWKKYEPDQATISLQMSYPYDNRCSLTSLNLKYSSRTDKVRTGEKFEQLGLVITYEEDLLEKQPIFRISGTGKEAYEKLIKIASDFFDTLEKYRPEKS